MAVTSWCFPTTTGFTIQGNATNDWTNPTNAYADDGANTTRLNTIFGGPYRQSYGNFGFGVPTSAIIQGIEFECQNSTDGGTMYGDFRAGASRSVGDYSAALITYTSTEHVETYGGATSMWGNITTGAHVADSAMYISVDVASGAANTAQIDYIKARVYYQMPSGFIPFFI